MEPRSSHRIPPDSPAANPSDPFRSLRDSIAALDTDIGLASAGLSIAAVHYANLDVEAHLKQLNDLAISAGRYVGPVRKPEQRAALLGRFLYEGAGFRGNECNYYDPANSFLNEVLERRLGIPITLSVVYLTIASKIGLQAAGVGMPMRFLVGLTHDSRTPRFIDPYDGGKMLSAKECEELLERIAGGPVRFSADYLSPVPRDRILYRLLNNLKTIYINRDKPQAAALVVDQMLIVDPNSAGNMKDRGLLHLQARETAQGIALLNRYLEREPRACDAKLVQEAITRAIRERAGRN